ncbi:MAG: hypothetical protein ACPL4K_06145, partial [Candidatus Margulisiibacteriota bacterium]
DQITLNFNWVDHSLSFSSCRVTLPESDFDFNFSLEKDGSLRGSLEGKANLSSFQEILKNYGRFEGRVGLAAIFSGKVDKPALQTSFWALDFRFNEIYFDEISGSLKYENDNLSILQPIKFLRVPDLYFLSGNAAFYPQTDTNLKLTIANSQLSSSYQLFWQIYGILNRFFVPLAKSKNIKLNLSEIPVFNWQVFKRDHLVNLYSANGEKEYFLKTWLETKSEFEKALAISPEEKIGGILLGTVEVKGKTDNLSGIFSLRVTNGYYGDFYFDELQAEGTLNHREIKIEKALLFKKEGTLSAQGSYKFSGNIAFYLVANNLPLETLKLIFPNEEFSGYFSMNADLNGPLSNLSIVCAIGAEDISISGINFNKLAFSFTKKENYLFIHEFSLLEQNQLSRIFGSIPLQPQGKFDLEVDLKDNAVGLLNLWLNEVKWREGKTTIAAKITGSPENLNAHGKIQVSQGKIYLKGLDSELQNLEGKAELKGNLLNINYLTAIWQGKTTRHYQNRLGLAGTID